MTNKIQKLKGFTLIELIVVIGIIVILAAIVLVAINPGRQIAQANNASRQSSTVAILNAINQHAIDLLSGAASGSSPLPTGHAACGATYNVPPTGTGSLDASVPSTNRINFDNVAFDVLIPNYISAKPLDPQGTTAGADFTVCQNTSSRVTVYARLTQATSSGATPLIMSSR